MQDDGLFIIWITFTVAALIGLCAVLVWAVRSRQFSNQNEARYLPLKSGIPGGLQAPVAATSGRRDPSAATTSGRRNRRSETATGGLVQRSETAATAKERSGHVSQ